MKHVLIHSRRPLLASGLEALLRSEDGLAVTSRNVGADEAVAYARELQPDVVIVDEGISGVETAIVRLVLMGIRVISLDPNENLLRVYQCKECRVSDVADLIDAIRGDEVPGLTQE